jgi:hypothetical protein
LGTIVGVIFSRLTYPWKKVVSVAVHETLRHELPKDQFRVIRVNDDIMRVVCLERAQWYDVWTANGRATLKVDGTSEPLREVRFYWRWGLGRKISREMVPFIK